MTGRLRKWEEIDPFQHKAIDALFHADEKLGLLVTGFGKTMVSMTAGDELHQTGVIKRPIVFAPLRVAQLNWPGERYEWEHLAHIEMVEWGGPPEDWKPSLWKDSRVLYGKRLYLEQRLPGVVDVRERRIMEDKLAEIARQERVVNKAIRKTEPPACWHVTSFENIEWFTELYAPGESPFDLFIVDETGKLARNPKSPRYKAMKKHMPFAKIRWGLSATPAPEGLEDLFGQVQLVAGKKLWGSSFYQWRQKFFAPADFRGYTWRPQIGAFDLIMKDLNTLAFQVPPEALAYQKNITHRQIKCVLPPKARAAYEEMKKQSAVEIADGIDVVALSEASASNKLRQITNGFLYEVDDKGRRTVHILHEEKLHRLSDLIDSMAGEPLIVAYGFDQDLDNIRKVFKNVPYLGQGASAKDAASHVAHWNKRELPVLALHPNSASHGLNLQYGGHNICWLTLPWGLDPYTQTNERLDRRGQTHRCWGHHIIAEDSKDQDVSDVLVEKNANQNMVIDAIRKL